MIDENTRVRNESSLLEFTREPDALLIDSSAVYLGYKWSGNHAFDDPMWSIKRIRWDDTTGEVSVMWANGNKRQCIFLFSECTTYPYAFA
ncbi:MAG: hypothetical protein LBF90_03300 [Prevotellaceae bacterium]|jgi:hypothetical protein|nr:hypothetical protein [Prevotellaceae bacterium]